MNFNKSESYSLTPDEYLTRFKTPNSEISNKGSEELDKKDRETLEEILKKSYNDNE